MLFKFSFRNFQDCGDYLSLSPQIVMSCVRVGFNSYSDCMAGPQPILERGELQLQLLEERMQYRCREGCLQEVRLGSSVWGLVSEGGKIG